jgi:hypothetical protein
VTSVNFPQNRISSLRIAAILRIPGRPRAFSAAGGTTQHHHARRLKIEPAANCGRYGDSIRKVA